VNRALVSKQSEAAAPARANGLRIAPQGDTFEREADRAADAVMDGGATALPRWSLSAIGAGALQRKCACGGSSGGSGQCEECREKKTLQRKEAGPANPTHTAPSIVHEVLRSPGRPLDGGTRSFMESRFRHSFGQVRVHTGAQAAESARAVNALAYTVGSDVVFGEGQYAPHSGKGRSLLAHELTHTIQQATAPKLMPARVPMGPVHDPLEREADRNARDIGMDASAPFPFAGTSGLRLQRQPAPAGKTCSVELCFVPIKRFHLSVAGVGFSHAVINVTEGGGPKHVEVDPDFDQPKGMLHSHVVSSGGLKEEGDCQAVPATCAEAAKVVASANEYEVKDVIYDPTTVTGPNSNSFAEWTLTNAGLNTATVNVPTLASGWDYFQKNPDQRTDPPHVLRGKPTVAKAPKSTSGAACTKTFKKAGNAAEFVGLVREAESKMAAAGISTNEEKIKILRGLYYGTPWSVDFGDQASVSRIAGFQTFTKSGIKYPRDPVSLFDCGLYQALQVSQDTPGKSGKVDMGHLMIALDARNATVSVPGIGPVDTPNLRFPGFGGSGVEIVTWLGDLGGGAASLAIDRARSPKSPMNVSKKFTGDDYGAGSNLEGDVAGFLVARTSGGSSGADVPTIPAGKGIADALEDYFAASPKASSTAWDQRAKTFLTMYGGAFDATGNLTNAADVIKDLADKIESFACNYLAQRKADSSVSISDTLFVDAADNIRPCSKEVAETFVTTLAKTSKTPGLALQATGPFPTPSPPDPGACAVMAGALRLKAKAQKLKDLF
jgi:hypothetical protein